MIITVVFTSGSIDFVRVTDLAVAPLELNTLSKLMEASIATTVDTETGEVLSATTISQKSLDGIMTVVTTAFTPFISLLCLLLFLENESRPL